MFKENFRQKFVDYLSNGMPIYISEEEVHMFYEALDSFINQAPNDFESYYLKGEDSLTICDKYVEYLNVSYEDSKIIFKIPASSTPVSFMQDDHQRLTGEAFIGVLLFVEHLSPSDDLKIFKEEYLANWY